LVVLLISSAAVDTGTRSAIKSTFV